MGRSTICYSPNYPPSPAWIKDTLSTIKRSVVGQVIVPETKCLNCSSQTTGNILQSIEDILGELRRATLFPMHSRLTCSVSHRVYAVHSQRSLPLPPLLLPRLCLFLLLRRGNNLKFMCEENI